MVLGIMQPYFFPYLGYYQLMMAVDRWIVFDIVKYAHRSWMNRNRVLHPTTGWQYVGVPVHAKRDTRIDAVAVVDRRAAQERILGQLDHYRGKAPHFRAVRDLVRQTFASATTGKLRDLNVQSLLAVCDYLGTPFDWSNCSEMELSLPVIEHPGQWALEISKAVGARRYVNRPGGRPIFRPKEWETAGIELCFLEPPTFRYPTGPYNFEADLSILDVLMWNDPAAVIQHMKSTLSISA
jgi:hypothetical protein